MPEQQARNQVADLKLGAYRSVLMPERVPAHTQAVAALGYVATLAGAGEYTIPRFENVPHLIARQLQRLNNLNRQGNGHVRPGLRIDERQRPLPRVDVAPAQARK